jgi:Tfp pilus assembly protein PilF
MELSRMKITKESLFLLWEIATKEGDFYLAKKYAAAHDELHKKIRELESKQIRECAA